jgi:hypothetical protein
MGVSATLRHGNSDFSRTSAKQSNARAAAIFPDESDAFFRRSLNRANAARANVAARFLNNFQQSEPCRFCQPSAALTGPIAARSAECITRQ